MMKSVLLVLALVGACLAIAPPAVPSTFYGEVRAEMHKDGRNWIGGGIYALDVANSRSVLDIKMLPHNGDGKEWFKIRQINSNNLTYTVSDDKCTRSTGQSINDLFNWLPKASLVRSFEKEGVKYDVWGVKDGFEATFTHESNELVHYAAGSYSDAIFTPVMELSFLSVQAGRNDEWIFHVPKRCTVLRPGMFVGDANDAANWANQNWNCLDVACSTRVPPGTGQPNYGCAEFVARSLCAGGFIPGVGPTDPQGSYLSWSYQGTSYDLCWVSSLSTALGVLGFTKEPPQASSVVTGCGVMGDGGDGPWSHAVIGVDTNNDIDAHNNARQGIPVSDDLINGIDAVWCPSGTPPPPSTSGYTGASSYTSSALGADEEGNANVLYSAKGGNGKGENDMKVIEVKSNSKF